MDDLLQVSEMSIMKVHTLLVAVGLAGMAGVALAAGPGNTMPAVSVHSVSISACTPPNGATGHACDTYDAFLRANFSAEEIRSLFGCRSCEPGYLAGERTQLVNRYDALLQQYLAVHPTARAATQIASK